MDRKKKRPTKLPRSQSGWSRNTQGIIETSDATRVVVSIDTDETGSRFLTIRRWVAKQGAATMTPTKSGVTVPLNKSKDVAELISKAVEQAV